MTDLHPTPASLGHSRSVRARLTGAVLALLAVFLLSSAAPAGLTHLPGVGAVVGVPDACSASADSFYNDEGCHNGISTWTLNKAGGNADFQQLRMLRPPSPSSSPTSLGTGPASGSAAARHLRVLRAQRPHWPVPSPIQRGIDPVLRPYGFGAGLMGDTGSGLYADNDPRNFTKGQAIPNSTVGQSADCWGYGDAYTQVVTVDHANNSPGSAYCEADFGNVSYNLSGQNFVAVGIGAESRDCSDSADGGDCRNEGGGSVDITTPVVQIDDPANGPSLSGLAVNGLPSGYNPADWLSYEADSGTIGSSVSAQDSAGVCNVQITISGPAALWPPAATQWAPSRLAMTRAPGISSPPAAQRPPAARKATPPGRVA